MKLPNRAKIVWWLLLLGFFAYLLSQRYDSIMSGAASATDIVIFLIFIALFSAPLFQEVDFFGVRLKREIDTLRTEFKEQIINLRSDINTVNMRAEINPQIYLQPPPDSALQSIEERIRPVLEQVLKEQGIQKPAPAKELEVPDNTVFLFKVRYSIENELKRIGKWLLAPPEERPPQTLLQMANVLFRGGVIVKAAIDSIREINAICLQAIHGEDVSKASVQFVKEMSPTLLAYLKSVEEAPPPWHQWVPKPWVSTWEPPPKE
ncbi:MAG: hypothetical protein KAV68_06220 [Dehalococcoidales bacterium]|nr:hypothetical protein [Dehalococcoidales bacterium]